MSRYFLALFAFCILSIVAIIALQPDPLIHFEAELSRMKPEQALETLDAPGAYEIEQHNIALGHAELLMASGNLEGARALLEVIEATLPRNAEVRRRRAQLAKLKNETGAVVDFETAKYAAEHTPKGRATLGLAHRLQRDPKAEIDVLRSVPPEQLSTWEAQRLARLLQATGAHAEAEALFSRLAGGTGELADQAKARLIVMQIDEGRSRDALKEALTWYEVSEFDPAIFETVLPVFLARGAIDEAVWFADQIIELSPASGHKLLHIFSSSGHRAIASRIQDLILSRQTAASEEEWAAIVAFASLTGDVRGLQKIIAGAEQGSIPTATLSNAFLQMLRYQGPRALTPYRQFISEDLADHAPLIAAAFAVEQAQPEVAVRHLVAAAETDLNAWDQSIWLSMALKLTDTGYDRLLLTSPYVPQPLKDALTGS